MHISIVELSDKKLKPEDYLLEEYLYYEDLPYDYIDYVYSISSTEDVGERKNGFVLDLEKHGAVFNEEENSISFPKGFRDSYFKEHYINFKKLSESLSFESFISPFSRETFDIKSSFNDKMSDYVYIEGNTFTLFDFLKHVEIDDKTFYFGNIIGGHI